MAEVKVALGYVHPDEGRVTSFEHSLSALRTWDSAHSQVLSVLLPVRFGTDGIVDARNKMAAALIESDCDWLLVVDTDMGFAPDALDKLLAVADPETRPVVGGLCFASRQHSHDGMNGWLTFPAPTLYDWKDNPDGGSGFTYVPMYPVNAVYKVAATGAAFILIHRSVLEKVAERFGPTWYNRTPAPNGDLLGEDISFCVRCAMVDVPIWVHTGVRTSHYKGQWLQEVDHWRRYYAPPATERTAVIVPTRHRAKNAQPFMDTLRASTGLATAYAICDADDPEGIEAWRAAGAEVIVDSVVTFAKKVNLGYSKTSEPWLFLVGDDVRFHPGWLNHAQHVADVFKADVVGTNDWGNERVMRGEHATHMLVRRTYVDDLGASWDGPGTVCHEGYRHWFCDDELVTAAKMRGTFYSALGSVVEHLHPLFGRGETDETYEVIKPFVESDYGLFQARLAERMPAVES
jgi:GT2 family glycosyltransferase